MSDQAVWSKDVCTCGHKVYKHADSEGRCEDCDTAAHYGSHPVCTRYQWNGEPRRRIW